MPQTDRDGNDVAGVRLPDVSVPLATLTGWNFRKADIGAPDQLFPLLGSYVPLSSKRALAKPRRSSSMDQERYRSRADTCSRFARRRLLVKGRYLLPEDVASIVRRAEDHWNALAAQSTTTSAARSPR